ncbi:MAG TPA: VOC family protein [Gammaproteobacteria bacterium]
METNPIGWFEIYVEDMPRARKFYEAVFQAKLEKLPSPQIEMWNFPMSPEAAGAAGALVKMEGFPAGGTSNSVLVYFKCKDCAVEESRVVKAGGRIQRKKMPIGDHGFISLVFDTEGNMIGLHSMK